MLWHGEKFTIPGVTGEFEVYMWTRWRWSSASWELRSGFLSGFWPLQGMEEFGSQGVGLDLFRVAHWQLVVGDAGKFFIITIVGFRTLIVFLSRIPYLGVQ